MKIIYITRLFSGIETSIINGIWKPSGVPTIFKMIDYLDKNTEVKFVFTVKDSGKDFRSKWKKRNDTLKSIDGLKNLVTILSGENYFPSFFHNKIKKILRELRQAIKILFIIYKFDPSIIYIDNSNIIAASLIKKIMPKKKIVLRIMGVYPYMKSIKNSKKLTDRIYKKFYNTQYSLVICTQDGSGVTKWCDDFINKKTITKILLNGIDKKIDYNNIDYRLKNLPIDKFKILFIGKLELYKGAKDFVDALFILQDNFPNFFHGVLIGSGNLENELNSYISKKGYDNSFTFIKKIDHNQIHNAHKLTDIYVSLNRYGNLSNVNLEAIYYGNTIIIPESLKNLDIDIETDNIIDDQSVIRIKNDDIINNLVKEIVKIKENNDLRNKLKMNLKILSDKIIISWDIRIKQEIDLINDLLIS